jgi:hypothetical protein
MITNINILVALCLLSLGGCAITPAPVSTSPNDPSNPLAAEAITPPLQPGLVAGAKTYLSPRTGADAQKMQHGRGDLRSPAGMDHGATNGMEEMAGKAGAPRNPAEQVVAQELRSEPSPAVPTGEQLQNIHPSDYTCRMHPEIHSDEPGKCPKCGMPLVTRESLEKNKAMEERK